MTNSLSEGSGSGEKSTESAAGDLASVLLTHLTQNPDLVPVLQDVGAPTVARVLKERKERKRPKRKVAPKVTGWDKPPPVDEDAAEDLRSMISEHYDAMDEDTAKDVFTGNGLDWDTCDAATFARLIAQLAKKEDTELSSAMFVFCDNRIPPIHRDNWVIRIMVANDRHQEEDF